VKAAHQKWWECVDVEVVVLLDGETYFEGVEVER
jgi:hypothetical protein